MYQHKTVLLNEAVDALALREDSVVIDGTFGRGGHSREILKRLGSRGRLIALDKDPQAINAAGEIEDTRFSAVHSSFAKINEVLTELNIKKINAVLLDLGVSSPQLEDPRRGFSFRMEGPLDMRMDTTSGIPVSQWLAKANEQELKEVIENYGEERFAKRVAKAIVAARSHEPIVTTTQLAKIVASAVRTHEAQQNPATRTFQALRIFINQELTELSLTLNKILDLLAPGGRLAVISFHSLEDRIVKRFMQSASKPAELPVDLPIRASELPQPNFRIVGKAIRPSEEEVKENPRACSAVMRVGEKL